MRQIHLIIENIIHFYAKDKEATALVSCQFNFRCYYWSCITLLINSETIMAKAKTVIWNGPMGCFEMAPFAAGTMGVLNAVAEADCVSIIGGGDSVSAVNKSGLAGNMTHISTGGGASLELLEGKDLPGLVALSDK